MSDVTLERVARDATRTWRASRADAPEELVDRLRSRAATVIRGASGAVERRKLVALLEELGRLDMVNDIAEVPKPRKQAADESELEVEDVIRTCRRAIATLNPEARKAAIQLLLAVELGA